jgi:uncharacterized membrane protein YjfL (UPF0719 family)
MSKTALIGLTATVLVLSWAAVGFAQDVLPTPVSSGIEGEIKPLPDYLIVLKQIVKILIFSATGLIVLLLGMKALDLVAPFSLRQHVGEEKNTAVAIVMAGALVALGIVVYAAFSLI